jgi:hypothetical protein
MHDPANRPDRFHAACLTSDGARCWAVSTDADLMATAMAEDLGGRPATVAGDGTLTLG